MGCTDSSCITELAGALDADRTLSGSVARVGETLILSFTILDNRKGQGLHRAGARVKAASTDAAFDQIDRLLLELMRNDPKVEPIAKNMRLESGELASNPSNPSAVATDPANPPASTASKGRTWSISAGARVDTDFMGLVDGAPAVAPGIIVAYADGFLGAAVTWVIAPVMGARAEARFNLLPQKKARPFVGGGLTMFFTPVDPSFGLRGVLGVIGDLGPLQLFADFGVEGFLSGPVQFRQLALLLGAGAAYRF